MRESLKDWLKDRGYDVETAEEGEQALEKIGKKEFSVAVLDLRLPGKDGLEVLKEATAKDPKIKGDSHNNLSFSWPSCSNGVY
jgi:DNA-binding response OmpR family regulator